LDDDQFYTLLETMKSFGIHTDSLSEDLRQVFRRAAIYARVLHAAIPAAVQAPEDVEDPQDVDEDEDWLDDFRPAEGAPANPDSDMNE
jgi:hypothetical protein